MWDSIMAAVSSWWAQLPALRTYLEGQATWLWGQFRSPVGGYSVATVTGAFALAMLFPGRVRRAWQRPVGVVLFLASAVLFFGQHGAGEGGGLLAGIVWLLTLVTLLAGLAMITSRKPAYSAIWFALTLLGVGGLFLVAGAQFLGIATVAVYAGAIVVTFLFVLMLAQPGGHAVCDRISWGWLPRFLGSLAALLVAALVSGASAGVVEETADRPAPAATVAAEHVARLGGVLFSRYLIEIQVAGTLLLVALVGAVAMASQRVVGEVRRSPGDRPPRLEAAPGGGDGHV